MSSSNHNPEHLSASPVEVVEAFYQNHSVDEVKLTLLEALQGYALNENKGFLNLNAGEEQVAGVFDSLIALVGAVEALIATGKIEGLEA